ncbi:hypothetical protein SADUNF_Sadunf05G0091800 [Salix dunnii]|uniref:Secreted protein n=1 Tax=Salix dunnii TaxID=1413687 RepID=A0A835KC82_9ROSI|nr:hypothetical protein SADUNF_Sadunf05G0091800 [Salix dunnii]
MNFVVLIDVMCLFGLHQHTSNGVDTLDNLFVANHRRKKYINLWHARGDHIFTEFYLRIILDLYMSWYMNINRQFITPPWKSVMRHGRGVMTAIHDATSNVMCGTFTLWFSSCCSSSCCSSLDEAGEA